MWKMIHASYFIIMGIILWCDNVVKSNIHEKHKLPHSSNGKDFKSDNLPLIFWWTSRLDSSLRGATAVNKLYCPGTTCLTTNNRKYLTASRSIVFMFYGSDLDATDLPFPRKKNHEWAIFHEESPMNNYMLSHSTFIKNFNYTATFKRESDFPLTSQHIPSGDYLTKRKPVSLHLKNKFREEGIAPILYIQSHCDVASDRDRYVKELMKYIKIDSYGKCLNNKVLPTDLVDPVENMHTDKFLKFIGRYKFHLSFENALCTDYMTEKLFRALHVGSVPIYRGSNLATDYMPDNRSIIMAENYESPQKLAKYIQFLDTNDEEYLKYLSFKEDGITNTFLKRELKQRLYSTQGVMPFPYDAETKPDMMNAFECYVCQEVADRAKQMHTGKRTIEPRTADKSHLHCPQPYTSIGYPEDYPVNDSWLQAVWIDDYWSGLDKAVAVERMVKENETNPKSFDYYWRKVTYEFPRSSNNDNF